MLEAAMNLTGTPGWHKDAIAFGAMEDSGDVSCIAVFQNFAGGVAEVHLAPIGAPMRPEVIDDFLYTAGQPDPDLIIRTSGEVRLSGFLLWQGAYAEYYFCDTYWPAFRRIDFLRALREYSQRSRRFGR